MDASKQFLANYLFKTPTFGEKHHLWGTYLEVATNQFATILETPLPNQRSMDTMDNIMELKEYLVLNISW
jgi:hypothetical protein